MDGRTEQDRPRVCCHHGHGLTGRRPPVTDPAALRENALLTSCFAFEHTAEGQPDDVLPPIYSGDGLGCV